MYAQIDHPASEQSPESACLPAGQPGFITFRELDGSATTRITLSGTRLARAATRS